MDLDRKMIEIMNDFEKKCKHQVNQQKRCPHYNFGINQIDLKVLDYE